MHAIKKLKFYKLLFIPIALSLALPLSVIGPQIADAATPVTTLTSPSDQALSYWYYYALTYCFTEADSSSGSSIAMNTDNKDLSSGQIFGNAPFGDHTQVFGSMLDGLLDDVGSDGQTSCSATNNQLVQKALDLWNITSIDLVCNMGLTRQGNQPCTGAGVSNDFNISDSLSNSLETAFQSYISKTIYGGNKRPTLDTAASYYFDSQTLIKGCTTNVGTANKPASASASQYYALDTTTDSSGNPVATYYIVNGRSTAYENPGDGKDSIVCKTLLTSANNEFGAFISQTACSNNADYKSSTSLIQACINGSNNKGNIDYCATQYPDDQAGPSGEVQVNSEASTREACYAGQGNPGYEQCSEGMSLGNTKLNTALDKIKSAESSGLLDACAAGANNSTDSTYCADKYGDPEESTATISASALASITAERNACLEGQQTPVTSIYSSVTTATNCQATPTAASCSDSNTTSCVVDNIGWIVCPVLNALGGLDDAMYGWIASVLTLNPLQIHDSSGAATPTYQNWQTIRNIANVLLVIAFLLVIFSQITNVGISNYGVKKMLPRIIMIAIAINISYFIMSIGIDVVNIIGTSLEGVLANSAVSASIATLDPSNVIGGLVTGSSIVGIGAIAGVAGIAATGSGLSTLVLLAVPFVLVAVLGLLAAVATLFIRNALVIILVILSPLALAAYVLPNTQEWFTRWRKLLTSMLFLFPVAAVLFGGAKLAAYIILTSNEPLGGLIAIFVMAAPLGALPWLARSSGGILGTIGGKLQGLAKSAKAPTTKALSSFVDKQRAQYANGQKNFLGRKQNPNKRNLAQRFGEARKSRASETETAKALGDKSYADLANGATGEALGAAGSTRGGRRARKAIQGQLSASGGKSTSDAQSQARFDSGLKAGGNVDAANYEAKKEAEFGSGISKGVADTRFEETRAIDPTLRASALEGAASQARQGVLKKQEEQLVAEASTSSNALHLSDIDKSVRETLKVSHEGSQVAEAATGAAKRVQAGEYLQELRGDGTAPTAVAIAAGGIDPNGVPRVIAQAAEAQRKVRSENVTAGMAELEREGHSGDQLVTMLQAASTQPINNTNSERVEAVLRAAVATNDSRVIQEANDYMALIAANPANTVIGANGESGPSAYLLAVQQAYGAAVGASPSKPKFIGGAVLGKYKTGTQTGSSDQLVVDMIESNKVAPETFVGMDVEVMKRMVSVLGAKGRAAGLTAEQRETLSKNIESALTEENTRGKFEPRQQEQMREVQRIVGSVVDPNAPIPPIPPTPPTPPEVPPSIYFS